MPLELHQLNDQAITYVNATGTLDKSDYPRFAAEFERAAQKQGKLRIFFDMTKASGWDGGAIWSEIKFDAKHFEQIQRMAVVGDKSWEKVWTTFAEPFTMAEIRYFDAANSEEAVRWLKSSEQAA
jgi:hypothetical protein